MKPTTFVAVSVAALTAFASGAHAAHAERVADPSRQTAPQQSSVRQGAVAEFPQLLRLTLDDGAESSGVVLTRLVNTGVAPVQTVVVADAGGEALRVPRGDGRWAARLPRYSRQADPPRAVIRVLGAVADPFDPGTRAFRFGAAWNLDEVSQGTDADNGDNLMQRGLSGDAGQFKLELDNRVPACTVQGDDGAVTVTAGRVEAGQWYGARCYRDGMELTLHVYKWTPEGLVTVDSTTKRGPIGSVSFPSHIPVSIGGKLDQSGDPVSASGDQFNGMVDNIVFDTVG
jgi:hypothetical protein